MLLSLFVLTFLLPDSGSATPKHLNSQSAADGCKTSSGGPQIDAACVFPFIYKGKEYKECTFEKGDEKPWCSTKVDGDRKHVGGQQQWGYCGEQCPIRSQEQCRTTKTTSGKKDTPCVFPFIYKGKGYTKCLWEEGESEAWCSTKVTKRGFHVGKQGQWGYCNSNCPIPPNPEANPDENEVIDDEKNDESTMTTEDEIFDNEVDNPNDLRLDNELEEGEEDYEEEDYDGFGDYGDGNLPDLGLSLDRIAGSSDTYYVAGTSGVSEITTKTKGCKRKCLQYKRVRKDGILGNLVWKCVKKGCQAPKRDR